MHAGSASRIALALLAVLYLCAAGWFFVLAPWTRFWASHVLPGAPGWLIPLLDAPLLRGALSGFGVLHFPVAAAWLARSGERS